MARRKTSLLRRPGAPRPAAGGSGGPAAVIAKKKKKKRKPAWGGQEGGRNGDGRPAAGGGAPAFAPAWAPAGPVDRQAAAAVARLLAAAAGTARGASLKSLTLAPGVHAPTATHAVAARTLQHAAALSAALEGAGLLAAHPRLTRPVALVLTYEVLLGQGLRPTGPAERAVLAAKADLAAALATARATGSLPAPAPPPPPRPRSVRVNTLTWTVEEAMRALTGDGDGDDDDAPPARHALLPDVLLFPPGTDLHAHPAVLDGRLILQSASSCMPAHVLAPQPGWTVLDACAAPGNKTTHVAAFVGPTGTVIGCDRDARRLETLAGAAARSRTSAIIRPLHADFLSLSPASRPDLPLGGVHAILLDPSCSGSGTSAVRGDWLNTAAAVGGGGKNDEQEAERGAARLERLASFQEAALAHALAAFPAAVRVTYSTCSVHVRENEAVVARVLGAGGARAGGWRLEAALPAWPRRGLAGAVDGLSDAEAACLVRVDPILDETDGFFVALFAREEAAVDAGK